MRRVSFFAAVVAVLVVGGCSGGSDQPPDTGAASPGSTTAMEDAPVLETSGDTVKKAHVRMRVRCADGHADVRIDGWAVVVHQGAEVKWHLAAGGVTRVTLETKPGAGSGWGLAQPLPLVVPADDSVSGGAARTVGTWRYNLRYQCQLGDSTHQGVIDPEVIIVSGP